ncbi:MAG: hypothetical protein H8E62_11565, partial [Planctomycetes bacterium]|nr:hypothetical protein [Planctomycetota bacterium]
MKREFLFSGVVLFSILSVSLSAAETFDTYTLVQTGDYYDTVDIDAFPDSVTVDMTGGQIDSLSTWLGSTFNMTGGYVPELSAYENSIINISGSAQVDSLETYSNSSSEFSFVSLMGGSVGQLDCYGDSEVHVYGYGFVEDHAYALNTWLLSGYWEDTTPFAIELWNEGDT